MDKSTAHWYKKKILVHNHKHLIMRRTTKCRQKRLFSFLLKECTETKNFVEMVAPKIPTIYSKLKKTY